VGGLGLKGNEKSVEGTSREAEGIEGERDVRVW
jgi:hypothetical protein